MTRRTLRGIDPDVVADLKRNRKNGHAHFNYGFGLTVGDGFRLGAGMFLFSLFMLSVFVLFVFVLALLTGSSAGESAFLAFFAGLFAA